MNVAGHGAVPEVSIRYPWALLIWPCVFFSGMALLLTPGLVRSWLAGDRRVSAPIVFLFFVVAPMAFIFGAARSSVQSHGTALRVRNGYRTRLIPAEDISGFVLVYKTGERPGFLNEARPLGAGFGRVAIALRHGSSSVFADQGVGRSAMARRWRSVVAVLGNRWGTDLTLACLPDTAYSSRRTDRALVELEAWHRWALGQTPGRVISTGRPAPTGRRLRPSNTGTTPPFTTPG